VRLEGETPSNCSELKVAVEFEHADPVPEEVVPTPDRVVQGPNGGISALALHLVAALHDPSKEAATELDIDMAP